MIQDPEYIKKVHKALTSKVEGFNKTPEEFSAALKDEAYVNRVYTALSAKVDGFTKTPEEFKSLVYSPEKKNSNSTGTQTPKVSQSTPQPKPITSVGGKQPQATPSVSSTGGGIKVMGEDIQLTPKEKGVKTDMSGKPLVDIKRVKETSASLDKAKKAKKEAVSGILNKDIEEKQSQGLLPPTSLLIESGDVKLDIYSGGALEDFLKSISFEETIKPKSFEETIAKKPKVNYDNLIKANDYNLPNPYLYFSKSKEGDNQVDEFYTSNISKLPINKDDFDGFLRKNGYLNDINKDIESGVYEKDRGLFSENYNSQLIKEKRLVDYLSLYIDDKNQRDYNLRVIQYKKENPNATEKDIENNVTKYTFLSNDDLEKYIENSFPIYNKNLKERKNKEKEEWEETKKNKGDFFSWQTVKKIGSGVSETLGNRISNISSTVYDLIGLDNRATQIRFSAEEDAFKRPENRDISYVSGKKVSYNGSEYLVDSEGQIYDYELKKRVTDLFNNNQYKTILNSSKKGVEDNMFSWVGATVQTVSTVADLAVQIALTRGASGASSLAVRGLSKEGLSILSKVPVSNAIASSAASQTLLGYSEGLESTLLAAKNAGINDTEAKAIANDAAMKTAALYLFTSGLSPQTKAAFNKQKNELVKEAIDIYAKKGKPAYINFLNKGINDLGTFLKEGAKETGQEVIQEVGTVYGINPSINEAAGKDIVQTEMTADQVISMLPSTFVAGGIPIMARNIGGIFSRKDYLSNLDVASNNVDLSNKRLDELLANNAINKEEHTNAKEDLRVYSQNKNKIPKDTSVDIVLDVAKKLDEISKLEASKNNLDKAFHEKIDQEINNKRTEIKELYEKQPKETTAEKPIEEGPTGQENVQDATATQGQSNQVVQEEKNKVEELRQQEIAEFNKEAENAQDFITDGKVDANKVAESDNAKAKEIYAKYDAQIKPLLDNIKTQEDAIQKQSTGQVPVQSETTVSEEVEQGKSEAKPEGVTKEEIVPGSKAVVSGIEITYPTAEQETERKEARSKTEYVEEASKDLDVEDTTVMSKELDGDFGILTAENPMAKPLTEAENVALNKKAKQWLESRGYKPRRLTGKYAQAENSFFVPNLSKADAIAFAKEFNQDSVAHSEGLIYQDGSMNPRVKSDDDFSFSESYDSNSDNVSVVKTKDGLKTFSVGYNFNQKVGPNQNFVTISPTDINIDEKVEGTSNRRIAKIAVKAAKALYKVLPNVRIVLHNTNDSFVGISGESKNQSSSGLYQNGEIHINLEKANRRTVAHEVFHAILLDKVKTDSKAAETTKRMLNAILPTLDKNKALKQRLEDFADNYDENIQDEEKLAEFVGILAENYDSLSGRAKEAIKKWLNNLAKMFGVELFESNEVLDVLNTIAKKVATGKEIDKTETNILEGGSLVESPSDSLRKQKVGSFDVMYTEQEKIDKLIKDGLITEPEDTSFMNNEQVAITSPDDMLVGTISIDGKQIFEGGGGVFFVTKYSDVWASGKEGTANTLATAINNSLRNNKSGKGYLVLTKGSDSKLISSSSGVNSSLAVLESMLDKNLISLSDFRSAVSSSIKTFGGEISLRASAKQMKEDVNTYFSNPKESTFQRRGDVLNKIIASIAQSKSTKDNKDKIIEFLGGDKTKGIVTKVTTENKSRNQSLSDLIAGVASEKLTKGLGVGDVYAIIEVNGEVVVKEDSHPSYPFHVVQKDGKKPILHLPKLRENGSKTITTSSGKPYSVGNASIMSGKFNDTATRKQKALPQTVLSKLTETKDGDIVLKHYSDERRDVIKKGQGQNRITSTEESSALSSVGGIAMFYTMANQVEAGVGNVEHTVLVSKDKVYDIDSDPMGFEAEARKRFNEVRPGQAFTNNYRGAFITKIANENGFDIAVSQWRGGELRAQTTLELKPEKTNTQFKERPLPTFSVGEVAIIDGKESVIEKIEGDRLTYKSVDGTASGVTLNNERNRRSIIKIEPSPVARKQRAFEKSRKVAIKNVKGGKYGSLTNTSKSNKVTILEHETMKVKLLNIAMLFPKIVEKAVDVDLFNKYKDVILSMSGRRLAAQTTITAQEVADLYDQIIDDYTNFSDVQNAISNGIDINTLPDEQKDYYENNEDKFDKPKVEREKDIEKSKEEREELENQVVSLVPSIKDTPKDYDTKSMSFKIASLLADINPLDLKLLSNSQLENLRRVLETMSLGEDIPTYANDVYQEILSNRNMALESNIADKYNRTGFNRIPLRRKLTEMTDAIRGFFGENALTKKSNLESRASRYPLVLIDTANKIFGVLPKYSDAVLDNYGAIPIYKYILSSIEKGEGALASRNEEVAEVFKKSYDRLSEKTKDIDESLRKIHFAFLQVQAWANPGNKKVKSGVVSFTENFKNPDTPYSDKMKKQYEKFVDKYKGYSFIKSNDKLVVLDENGVDVTTEYFSREEMVAYKTIRKELDNQKARAEETSLFNNKNALPFVNEYFPENNFSKTASAQSIKEDPLSNNFSKKPSVKSKNLLEKTAQSHPVMHNPFAVSLISIKGTEMQYQLLNPIQVARKTLKKIKENNQKAIVESTGKEKARYNELGKVYDNIDGAIETLVEHLKGANIGKADALDNISDILTNTFYIGALASGIRTIPDLALNYQHLITAEPSALLEGFNQRKVVNRVVDKINKQNPDNVYRQILKYIEASQINRVMGVVNLTSVRSEFQSEGASSDIIRKGVESDASKLWKKVTGVFDPITSKGKLLNEALMSVSDNMPALNFFLGVFSNEFKDASGNNFDWEKAANNDSSYALDNAGAIEHASMIANFKLATYLGSKNVSSKSPVVVSAMRGQEGKILGKLKNRANYMFRQFQMSSTGQFLSALNTLFEVESMEDVSKQVRIMVGSGLRTSLYYAVSQSIINGIVGLILGDDEDEEIMRKNSNELSNDDEFIKKLYTLTESYKEFKKEASELNPELEFDIAEVFNADGKIKGEILDLLKDKRFRDLFDANYRFYAREMFSLRITELSKDNGLMKDYKESNVKDIIKRIDSGDKNISQIQLEMRLAYLNSEYGRSAINQEDREDYIEKIEEYLVDTKYYLLYNRIASDDEFDNTTPEGSFKAAALFVTMDNLLKHRDNSFMSNWEKGLVETAVNVTTGVRGSYPTQAVSYIVELINKKHKESTRGYYDFERDRYNYSTPDIMLSDKAFKPGKILESLTPPEITVLMRGFQRNKVTDAALIGLRMPGISDLNRISGGIKKDNIYENARGKFVENEMKQFLEKKLYLTEKEKEAKAKKDAEYKSKLVQDKDKIRRVTK